MPSGKASSMTLSLEQQRIFSPVQQLLPSPERSRATSTPASGQPSGRHMGAVPRQLHLVPTGEGSNKGHVLPCLTAVIVIGSLVAGLRIFKHFRHIFLQILAHTLRIFLVNASNERTSIRQLAI